jgi:hypothetical protein
VLDDQRDAVGVGIDERVQIRVGYLGYRPLRKLFVLAEVQRDISQIRPDVNVR